MKKIELFFTFFSLVGFILIVWYFLNANKINKIENGIITQSKSEIDHQITINSNIPNLKIDIEDSEKIVRFLEGLGFWNENAIANYTDYENKLTGNSVIVNISPNIEKSFFNQLDSSKNLINAVDASIQNGEVTITILLGEQILNQQPEQIKNWIEFSFWRAIYTIFKNKDKMVEGDQKRFKETEVFMQKMQKDISLFTVTKLQK